MGTATLREAVFPIHRLTTHDSRLNYTHLYLLCTFLYLLCTFLYSIIPNYTYLYLNKKHITSSHGAFRPHPPSIFYRCRSNPENYTLHDLPQGLLFPMGVAVSTLPASCFCSKKSVKIVSKKHFVVVCTLAYYALKRLSKKMCKNL